LITEPDKIRERWKEYLEQLYDKAGNQRRKESQWNEKLSFLKIAKALHCFTSEIIEAIKDMKKNKAVGVDDVPAEFLKALGEEGTKELVEMCKEMYNEGI
jgi:ATP-dependent exoDNAse (exonuclease V) beta subunit